MEDGKWSVGWLGERKGSLKVNYFMVVTLPLGIFLMRVSLQGTVLPMDGKLAVSREDMLSVMPLVLGI